MKMLQFIHIVRVSIWYTEDTKRRDVSMLELLTIVVFCWLSFKLLGLFFRMAWGAAKLIASILCAWRRAASDSSCPASTS